MELAMGGHLIGARAQDRFDSAGFDDVPVGSFASAVTRCGHVRHYFSASC